MKPLNGQQVAEVVRRYVSGESASSLSKAFGVNHETICNRLKWSGVQLRTRQESMRLLGKFSANEVAEIATLYGSGFTSLQLAARFKCSHTTILYLLNNLNITRRSKSEGRRKHRLNESAFDSINEESAYWIGFLMADGCVHEVKRGSPRIQLSLSQRDAAHLERFKRFIGSSHPITVSDRRGKRYSSFAASSTRIAESLARYGVTPRKSQTAKVADLEHDRHFWRGVFDGDGWVARNAERRAVLVGSKFLMEQFASFVAANMTDRSIAVKVKEQNLYIVRLSGKRAVRILRLLYSGCYVALPRKLENAERIIQQYRAKTRSQS